MYSKYCSVPKAKVAICPSVGWLKDFADAQTVLDPTFNGKNIIPANNSNWPQLNDPRSTRRWTQAETILDPAQRADAWGKIDQMVTAAAPGILWLWDKGPSIESKNVNGVLNKENAVLGPVVHVAEVAAAQGAEAAGGEGPATAGPLFYAAKRWLCTSFVRES